MIVEFGYRDQFDWRLGSRVAHLGQAAYDAYLQRQIDEYVKVLGQSGTKILLLSVPWTQPPSLPDGAPAPAASPARHAQINAMLRQAASRSPGQVKVLDIDSVVSPANHYQATLNGQLCRFDGVHFTLYCAKQLEPSVLGTVRKMIGSSGSPPIATIEAALGKGNRRHTRGPWSMRRGLPSTSRWVVDRGACVVGARLVVATRMDLASAAPHRHGRARFVASLSPLHGGATARSIYLTRDGRHWVAIWSASPQAPTPQTLGAKGFDDQTVRNVVFTSAGGSMVRVLITNVFGSRPLLVGQAAVGIWDGGADALRNAPLTFAGQTSKVIPAGAGGAERPGAVESGAAPAARHQRVLPRFTGPRPSTRSPSRPTMWPSATTRLTRVALPTATTTRRGTSWPASTP